MEQKTNQATTILTYYQKLSQSHPEAIVLLRVNDRYYTFGLRAKDVANVLEIPRMRTEKNHVSYTMFPANYLNVALPKLIRAGHRLAIADLDKQLAEMPFE